MDKSKASPLGGKIISFAAARARRAADCVQPAPPAVEAACQRGPGKDTVYFVTGGRFEAMVNGSVDVVTAGQFVRVPDGTAFAFADVGAIAGTLVSLRFPAEIAVGFLREIEAALTPFATTVPPRGSPARARLHAIARRWGVAFGSGEAGQGSTIDRGAQNASRSAPGRRPTLS